MSGAEHERDENIQLPDPQNPTGTVLDGPASDQQAGGFGLDHPED